MALRCLALYGSSSSELLSSASRAGDPRLRLCCGLLERAVTLTSLPPCSRTVPRNVPASSRRAVLSESWLLRALITRAMATDSSRNSWCKNAQTTSLLLSARAWARAAGSGAGDRCRDGAAVFFPRFAVRGPKCAKPNSISEHLSAQMCRAWRSAAK